MVYINQLLEYSTQSLISQLDDALIDTREKKVKINEKQVQINEMRAQNNEMRVQITNFKKH